MKFLCFHKICVLFLFLSLPFYKTYAQFINFGSDPFSFKWRQANTPHYTLIFPEGTDSIAGNYARYLELAFPHETKTIGHTIKRRFPVIIHPGNMLSNGLVAYAPRRMEILSTPSSSYAQRWDRQLAIHESRHVLQTDKLMQGIFNPFYYLFGEQVSGVSSFAVPSWFFEGDAVATETAMSKSGRGRLPEFHMPFRAQMMNGNFFSFDKWYMGSYKDYTSTYYALGYHMTVYARLTYGADIWDKVTYRFPRRFFSIPPFSNALKHFTGVNSKRLFKDTYAYLSQEWMRQDSLYHLSGFELLRKQLSPSQRYYTFYQYPLALDEETVVAFKSGLAEINALVRIKHGTEERIAYVGAVNSRLIFSEHKLYWTEYVSGLRWTHQNYSVLKSLDLNTQKIITLTAKDRLLTPAIDASGRKIAFSRPLMDGRNELVLMNMDDRKTETTVPVPENAYVKDLVFMDNGRLAAIVVGDEGIRLLTFNTSDLGWSELLGSVSVNIASLFWRDGYLYFESGADGTNNIYRMNVASGKTEKMTHVRFGAFTPSLFNDRMLFADYQPQGYQVVSVPLEKLKPVSTNFDESYSFELAETVAAQEAFNLDTVERNDFLLESKPYSKAMHLFRMHSWAPFYYDAMDVISMQGDDLTSVVEPGAMFLSQNALNTLIMQAGWYYKDREHHGKLAFTYMGLFPVFDFSLDYGGRTFDLLWKKNEEDEIYAEIRLADRRRIETEMRMYIPFNFSRDHQIKGFQPSVTYYYTNDKYQQIKSGKFGNFQYVLSELRYYTYRKMAVRDIYPRFGYQIRLQHLFSPFNSENYGNMYAARLTTYLPGLKKNDGLMLRLAYQFQDTDGKVFYFPKRLLEEPRGYDYLYSTRQMFTAKADYAFSLFCPDVSLGNLIYIKRFRSNLFYDFTMNQMNKTQKRWDTYNAVGADIIADCTFFRLNFPVSVGLRLVQPLDYGAFQVESLFSISF